VTESVRGPQARDVWEHYDDEQDILLRSRRADDAESSRRALKSPAAIALPRILLDAVDSFLDVAQIRDQFADPKSNMKNDEHERQKRGTA
jgi:hypothetical protein